MNRIAWSVFVLVLSVGLLAAPRQAAGATARLVKVLPQLLDRQGRVALNPSLYERDAYQFYLRRHPEECGGMRFEVQWKSKDTHEATLRLELRGNHGKVGTTQTIVQPVRLHGLFGRWSTVNFT